MVNSLALLGETVSLPQWRRPGAIRVRPGMGAAVLALHVLLLLMLWRVMHTREVQTRASPGSLLWIQPIRDRKALSPPKPAPPPETRADKAPATAHQPARPPERPISPISPAPAGESQWVTPLAPVAASSPPAPAASAPAPAGRLLDTDASRHALRQIGRQPLLQERAAAAAGESIERTDTGLTRDVAEAAQPDCLKDGKAASGQIGPIGLGGILGLPFLAGRVVTGKCAK